MALAFVSSGTVYGNAATATATPSLPGSIVAGNLLLALVGVRTSNTISVSGGWTLGDSKVVVSASTWTYQWVWRVATGSDTAPVFTWTGGTFACAAVVQLSGNYSTAPFFSAVVSNATGVGATHTAPSITATGANAALYVDIANAASSPLTTPSGWTSLYGNSASGVDLSIGTKSLAGTGSTSGAISTAGESDSWSMWQVEVLTQAPTFAITTDGGVLVGGAAGIVISGTVVTNGGVLVGGAATVVAKAAFNVVTSGGVTVGGAAAVEYISGIHTIAASAPVVTGALIAAAGTAGAISGTAKKASAVVTGIKGVTGTITATVPKATAVLSGGPQNIVATVPRATGVITALVGGIGAVTGRAPRTTGTLVAVVTGYATLTGSAKAATGSLTAVQSATASVTAKAPRARAVLTGYVTITGTITASTPRATSAFSGGSGVVATIVATAPFAKARFYTNVTIDAVAGEVVVNSITGAVTEYDNYGFDSFAVIGGTHYAAGADGIYELDSGGTDDGAAIAASFETGALSFKSEYLKRLESVYAAYRTSGDILVSVRTDEGKQYTYSMKWDKISDIRQRRVPVGKGLKGKYWQFKFENVAGASFGFDTFNILAHETVRRIGV